MAAPIEENENDDSDDFADGDGSRRWDGEDWEEDLFGEALFGGGPVRRGRARPARAVCLCMRQSKRTK